MSHIHSLCIQFGGISLERIFLLFRVFFLLKKRWLTLILLNGDTHTHRKTTTQREKMKAYDSNLQNNAEIKTTCTASSWWQNAMISSPLSIPENISKRISCYSKHKTHVPDYFCTQHSRKITEFECISNIQFFPILMRVNWQRNLFSHIRLMMQYELNSRIFSYLFVSYSNPHSKNVCRQQILYCHRVRTQQYLAHSKQTFYRLPNKCEKLLWLPRLCIYLMESALLNISMGINNNNTISKEKQSQHKPRSRQPSK